ncbi:MAG: carboxypeptidase-like regulatory domain-containing protein, partial [Patescibacteria group bacterium]
WTNPTWQYFASVVVVKSDTGIPTSPADGETIYQGSGTSVNDSNVETGRTYYYTAFVKSTYSEFSSGAVTSIRIPGVSPSPDVIPHPSGPPGFISTTSPFEQLPQVAPTDEKIRILSIKRFIFSQPGERDKTFDEGSSVSINGSKGLTISIAYNLMPEILKTIGVTIYDPDDPHKSFSFLLKLNGNKTTYEATIAPLRQDGTYKVSIFILNYQDQTIKKLDGQINVYGSLGQDQLAALARGMAPIALTGGIAVGVAQLIVTTSSVASLADVYLLILRQLGALLGYIGIRRKRKPWGTVYDSVTKRPIDPAYVTVQNLAGEEVASAITDIDGRYGFFLPPGEYHLAAQKTHYQFPSTYLKGRLTDELYDNLYFGGPVKTQGKEVINLNIPLDSLGFDWNEFIKGKTDYFQIHSKRDVVKARILNTIYIIGFLSAIGYFVFEPSWINIGIFLFYLGMYSFQYVWKLNHRFITASVIDTGEPLPFSIIRLYYADINQEVKKIVADALGRFYVLVRPGIYYLTVEEKLSDGSYQKVYQSEPMELKRGVLEKNILVKRLV